MSSCSVIIDGKEYDGEYNTEQNKLDVDIYNYSNTIEDDDDDGFVTHKEIIVYDYRNKNFFYYPFALCGLGNFNIPIFSITQGLRGSGKLFKSFDFYPWACPKAYFNTPSGRNRK